MAKLTFNAKAAAPMEDRSFALVSEGEHLFQIVKSEMKDNSKKTAQRLNLSAKILDGEFKGSIVFIGLNMGHPNTVCQDISDRELKSICDAVGKGNDEIEDSEDLHGIPFIGTVKHSAPSGEYVENGDTKYKYGAKAEIKKYAPVPDNYTPPAPTEAEGSGGGDAASASGTPPWKKD